MRRHPWILAALVLVYMAGAPLVVSIASADELNMTPAPQAQGNQPARGMSMEKVEATFGAPTSRVPAVGQPPITRWEYPGFVVYFEHNLVLHSVVKAAS
jgi:prolyl-tRNA editing enzyme YbaK/EbsC (Cys-tRNA(Pro) deacylase)